MTPQQIAEYEQELQSFNLHQFQCDIFDGKECNCVGEQIWKKCVELLVQAKRDGGVIFVPGIGRF